MANGAVQQPQPPPVGGPAPQRQAPPINVAQILGQLATSPPAGPIPITPYAPANVGPLAMPGAGLAGPSGKPPPWTGTPPAAPQQPAQPSVGSVMNPNLVPNQLGGTASGGGRGEVHNVAPPGPYAAQILQKLMGQQGMPPIMHQPVNVPSQPQPQAQQSYRPQALQALIPRASAAPTAAPPRAGVPVQGPVDPLTGRPIAYQQPLGYNTRHG
jgi:hypothetical protein